MAYRFTDTDKWKDSWFSNLNQVEKLLFMYLCDNCDIAGFAEVNLRRWAFDLNSTPSTIEGAKEGLRRGLIFSKCNEIVFIKNFLKHQKNLPLNLNNNAHLGISKRILMYAEKFDNEFIKELLEGAKEGLTSPTGKGNGKGKGKGKKEEGAKSQFSPPTIEDVKNEIVLKNYSVDAEAFVAFYDSKNWMVGKNKMKKWESALITWNKREQEKNPAAETSFFSEHLKRINEKRINHE